MTFIMVLIILKPSPMEILLQMIWYWYFPLMEHSCIRWNCPTVGSVYGSSQITHPICDTKKNMSSPVHSSLDPINQNILTHFCFLGFTIWQRCRRKVLWSGMHLRIGSLGHILISFLQLQTGHEWLISMAWWVTPEHTDAGCIARQKDAISQIQAFIILLCLCPWIMLSQGVIMVISMFITFRQPPLTNIHKISLMLCNLLMKPNTKCNTSRWEYLSQVCSVASPLIGTFPSQAVFLQTLCTLFHLISQIFSSTFGVETLIAIRVTIMIHVIGLYSKVRFGRIMENKSEILNHTSRVPSIAHLVTLQRKFLVDIRHGNFSRMCFPLGRVFFLMSFLTFIGRTIANLWPVFDFFTNTSSHQHSSLMLTSCSLNLLRSLRSYTISEKLNAFIFAAKVCMHYFKWLLRLSELVLELITHSGWWSKPLETLVRR